MSEEARTKMAAYKDPVSNPQSWDKAVQVAYLRLVGMTQKEAARVAQVGERTIRRWEECSWWEDARREAEPRWLRDLKAEARGTLFRAIRTTAQQLGDADKAMKVLERTDKRLLPPAHRVEHSGEIEGLEQQVVIVLPDNGRGDGPNSRRPETDPEKRGAGVSGNGAGS